MFAGFQSLIKNFKLTDILTLIIKVKLCLFNMCDKFTWSAGIRHYFFFVLYSTNTVKKLLLFTDVPRHAATNCSTTV